MRAQRDDSVDINISYVVFLVLKAARRKQHSDFLRCWAIN